MSSSSINETHLQKVMLHIQKNWETVAKGAYASYLASGRGVYMLTLGGVVEAERTFMLLYVSTSMIDKDHPLQEAITMYDPEEQIILGVELATEFVVSIISPLSKPSPKQLYEMQTPDWNPGSEYVN